MQKPPKVEIKCLFLNEPFLQYLRHDEWESKELHFAQKSGEQSDN